VKLTNIHHDIKPWQALRLDAGEAAKWWLGQAGFAVRCSRRDFLTGNSLLLAAGMMSRLS
jgi:hypothetical protein